MTNNEFYTFREKLIGNKYALCVKYIQKLEEEALKVSKYEDFHTVKLTMTELPIEVRLECLRQVWKEWIGNCREVEKFIAQI